MKAIMAAAMLSAGHSRGNEVIARWKAPEVFRVERSEETTQSTTTSTNTVVEDDARSRFNRNLFLLVLCGGLGNLICGVVGASMFITMADAGTYQGCTRCSSLGEMKPVKDSSVTLAILTAWLLLCGTTFIVLGSIIRRNGFLGQTAGLLRPSYLLPVVTLLLGLATFVHGLVFLVKKSRFDPTQACLEINAPYCNSGELLRINEWINVQRIRMGTSSLVVGAVATLVNLVLSPIITKLIHHTHLPHTESFHVGPATLLSPSNTHRPVSPQHLRLTDPPPPYEAVLQVKRTYSIAPPAYSLNA